MKLANGLRVIVARREGVPLVSSELVALAGAEVDPPRLSGPGVAERGTDDAGHQAPQRARARRRGRGARRLARQRRGLEPGDGVDHRDDAQARRRARARRRGRARAGVRGRRDRADPDADARCAQGRLRQPGNARLAGRRAARVRRRRLRPSGERHARIAAAHRVATTSSPCTGAPSGPTTRSLILAGDITPEAGLALARRHFGSWVAPAGPAPTPPVARAGAQGADVRRRRHGEVGPGRASSSRSPCPSAPAASARSARSSTRSSAAATRRA